MTVQFGTYAHMCRDGHEQIGHRDSEHEQCPLCRAMSALLQVREFMEEDIKSGDNALWTIGYSELFDLVDDTLATLLKNET